MMKIDEAPEVQAEIDEADVQDAVREETVDSILIDLEAWTSEYTGEQLAGFRAAMEVIKANYGRS